LSAKKKEAVSGSLGLFESKCCILANKLLGVVCWFVYSFFCEYKSRNIVYRSLSSDACDLLM